jgi:hypothetical protein
VSGPLKDQQLKVLNGTLLTGAQRRP